MTIQDEIKIKEYFKNLSANELQDLTFSLFKQCCFLADTIENLEIEIKLLETGMWNL